VRIDGSIYFGAVDHIQEQFHQLTELHPEQKHLLIIGNGINFIDIAGAELLVQEARRRRDLGGGLYLTKMKEEANKILDRGGFADAIGRENIFTTKYGAIEAIYRKLDRDICARCEARIFLECRGETVAGFIGRPAQSKSA